MVLRYSEHERQELAKDLVLERVSSQSSSRSTACAVLTSRRTKRLDRLSQHSQGEVSHPREIDERLHRRMR